MGVLQTDHHAVKHHQPLWMRNAPRMCCCGMNPNLQANPTASQQASEMRENGQARCWKFKLSDFHTAHWWQFNESIAFVKFVFFVAWSYFLPYPPFLPYKNFFLVVLAAFVDVWCIVGSACSWVGLRVRVARKDGKSVCVRLVCFHTSLIL